MSVPEMTIWADPRAVDDTAETTAALAAALEPQPGRDRRSSSSAWPSPTPRPTPTRGVRVRRPPGGRGDGRQGEGAQAEGHLRVPREQALLPVGDRSPRACSAPPTPTARASSGLEQQYDDLLTGTPGELIRERDQQGRTIPSGRRPGRAGPARRRPASHHRPHPAVRDRAVPARTGRRDPGPGWHGDRDGQPHRRPAGDGQRRASTTRPASPSWPRPTCAAVDTYEPGSVNKIDHRLGGAPGGRGDAGRRCSTCPYQYQYDDHVFTDAEPHGRRRGRLQDIVVHSSNIGTIKLAETLGSARLENYLRAFGFGDQTAARLPRRGGGPAARRTRSGAATENDTIAYGQGVGVTAMQMVAAMNTIANHGTYVAPRLVDATIDGQGKEHPIAALGDAPGAVGRTTAAEMNQILEQVVVRRHRRPAPRSPGYSVAGKTGTGYMAQSNGTYGDASGKKHYYASFVGFAPGREPAGSRSWCRSTSRPGGTTTAASVAAPRVRRGRPGGAAAVPDRRRPSPEAAARKPSHEPALSGADAGRRSWPSAAAGPPGASSVGADRQVPSTAITHDSRAVRAGRPLLLPAGRARRRSHASPPAAVDGRRRGAARRAAALDVGRGRRSSSTTPAPRWRRWRPRSTATRPRR